MLITVLVLFVIIQVGYFLLKVKGNNAKMICTTFSFLTFSLYLILFFFKSEHFGADTKNYLMEFSSYCNFPDNYIGHDYTYSTIFAFVNFLMLGNCEVHWLMWIWPLFIIGLTVFTCIHFKVEKLYLIALFSSFIGVELLTNAMRQGFSVAVLLLSFCFYINKKYFLFFIYMILSVLFHQASFLIAFIFVFSRLSLKVFVPAVTVSVYIVFFTPYIDFLPEIEVVRNSILRYLPYASEDFIIRAISLSLLIITYMVFIWHVRKEFSWSMKSINIMNNIVFICIIVSIVPYFGFRIIYGVYPLFLLLAYNEVKKTNGREYSFLSLITLINSAITIIWLSSSSYMRSLLFVNFI